MLWSHVTGVLGGTFSMTPRASSRSSCWRTSSRQCTGTVTGRLVTAGCAPASSTLIAKGGPVMSGRGWWGHVLNVEAAYWSKSHLRILGAFSCVGVNGSSSGRLGGVCRVGQPQAAVGCLGSSDCDIAAASPIHGKDGGWPSTVPWPCGWGRICPLRVIRMPLLTLPGGCPCHPFPGASGKWCQEAEYLHYSRRGGGAGQGQDLSSAAPFATVCIGPWGRTEPLCQRCTRSRYVVPMVQVCRCAHKQLHQLTHGGRVWAAAVILWRASRGFHRISCCRWLGAYPLARWCWSRQSCRKHLLRSSQPHCLMPGPWRPVGLGALALWPWSSRYRICTLQVYQTYFGGTWAWSCRILCTWSWCLVGHCLWGFWLGTCTMRWLTPCELRPWGPGLRAPWLQLWRWFRVGSCYQYQRLQTPPVQCLRMTVQRVSPIWWYRQRRKLSCRTDTSLKGRIC